VLLFDAHPSATTPTLPLPRPPFHYIKAHILENIKATASGGLTTPLLLGQSVLSEFSSVTQDNKNNVLILKR
jgi:hypothetical protein